LQELNELLDQAVSHEDYEKAAKIRDEISKDNFSIAFHYDFLDIDIKY
jgi:protein-arginine kinase activator protein McsA